MSFPRPLLLRVVARVSCSGAAGLQEAEAAERAVQEEAIASAAEEIKKKAKGPAVEGLAIEELRRMQRDAKVPQLGSPSAASSSPNPPSAFYSRPPPLPFLLFSLCLQEQADALGKLRIEARKAVAAAAAEAAERLCGRVAAAAPGGRAEVRGPGGPSGAPRPRQ